MIVHNFSYSNSWHSFLILLSSSLLLLLLLLLLSLSFFFLTAHLFLIGQQSLRANYISTFQNQIWSTFFFTEVTLWKIENNEEVMRKIPLFLTL